MFRVFQLTVCVVSFCLPCALTSRAEGADKPNVVFIMVDDMGYGDPQCFNPDSKIRTPHIDAVAAAGMRFTDAHAPGPLCHMSRYGLLTGRYPFRAKVEGWRREPSILPGQTTLASMLKQQGYRTAMVGKWHLGFAEDGYDKPLPGGPVDVGFDSYFGIRASTDIPPYFYIRGDRAVEPPTVPIEARYTEGWSRIQGEFWREGLIAPNMKLIDVLPRFTQEAIQVVEDHAQSPEDSPLFLYLAYPAPHTPWLPTPEFVGRSKVDMYGDFTEMVDAMIGEVLTSLEENGLADDTILFITSDNGPVWYEADAKRFQHDSAGGLRGMKADAWEAGHRMPFIVRWPNHVQANATSDQLLSFTDVLATLADITSYEMQPDDGPDSFSFAPVLLGHKTTETLRSELPLKSGSGTMMMRENNWKLINALGSGGFSEPKRVKAQEGEVNVQLYDLSSDLAEEHNVAESHDELTAHLKTRLAEIVESGRHRD